MSGSKSSAPGSAAPLAEALSFTVHTMPTPSLDGEAQRTRRGRWQMLALFLACLAPVVASYLTYYVIRPGGRTNYSELILPPRPMPALTLRDLDGRPVDPQSLRNQWLLVVVAGGDCDAECERQLVLQRQLRETLGREKDRVDKLWLIPDDAPLRPAVREAVQHVPSVTVLRVPAAELSAWLAPPPGASWTSAIYVVDPLGDWMMRTPPQPEPARFKRDVERLLRASAGWDQPGR